MAKVAPPPRFQHKDATSEWIDDYLDYLVREWEAVPALAEEWNEWDDYSRLSFDVDWSIREDRLAQLKKWAAEGRLTAEQRERYAELLQLIERNRPTLEALLAE